MPVDLTIGSDFTFFSLQVLHESLNKQIIHLLRTSNRSSLLSNWGAGIKLHVYSSGNPRFDRYSATT
ncbi:unnamed protein product [Lactuca virosa]|uniref:Uncharacterized protein n=1 Tax=Lactuca virosa TaxID=75947 RepID=A0AAU9PS74_9ASTR|nr:unnamed protein product [Lactuca virosa]